MKTQFTKLFQLSRLDTNNRSTNLSLNASKDAGDECAKRIAEVDKLLTEEAIAGKADSEAAYTSARWWIVAMTLIGLILGNGVAAFVTRSVTKPVFELRNLAQAMAGGDLRQRLEHVGTNGCRPVAGNSRRRHSEAIRVEVDEGDRRVATGKATRSR